MKKKDQEVVWKRQRQEAMSLHDAGMSYADIGRKLGVSRAYARQKVLRARREAQSDVCELQSLLTTGMINALFCAGYDTSEPGDDLWQLVNTDKWKNIPNFGRGSRDALLDALREQHRRRRS